MFTVDNSVMVLVDVQGKLAQIMHEKDALFASLKTMIQCMQAIGVPIIWMEQIPRNLGDTTPEIAQCVVDNSPIPKSSFSCCGEPAFMQALKASGRNQVILTGIETHICVFQTASDLIQRGCQVQVAKDCVSSRTLANKETGLERIVQVGGQVTCVEMAVFELLGKAEGDTFKKVIKLIK